MIGERGKRRESLVLIFCKKKTRVARATKRGNEPHYEEGSLTSSFSPLFSLPVPCPLFFPFRTSRYYVARPEASRGW